ncbi:MAG: hypothetical protein PWP40_2246 [Rhodocyclaceae bacterium]|nr:hypothetical protein [Rhodocyclaceae bacterium]
MKTATLPSIRVEPAVRQAAERVLREGETLSSFVEAAIRASIRQRSMQQAFVARGLKAAEDARTANDYFSPEALGIELDALLADAEERDRNPAAGGKA